MLKYLREAFWVSPQVPLLGSVPVNAVAVAGFVILGLGHPGFWLLGAGIEAAFLFGLATNKRFQKVVEAGELGDAERVTVQSRESVLRVLRPERVQKFRQLHAKSNRLRTLYQQGQDEFTIDANLRTLDQLDDLYLKLLQAEDRLAEIDLQSDPESLRAQMKRLRQEIAMARSPKVKESKQAALDLMERRLASAAKRVEALECISADLSRVENQLELALEHATLDGRLDNLSSQLDLVSYQFDDDDPLLEADSSQSFTPKLTPEELENPQPPQRPEERER
jgi:hypothetical protein